MNYKIVSDSASNVFEISGADYACVPLKVVCGDKEYVDIPKTDVSVMINDLKTTKLRSSTSCPNVSDWADAFEGADGVFAVTITSNLSGSYNAAVSAKEIFTSRNPGAKIHVFDTLSAGPEMRLVIEKLDELIAEGLEFDDIVEKVNAYMKKTHLLFCLESLNNLARNGRVHPAKAKIAGVLGIRVVGKASDEGTLQELHKARGADRGLDAIVKEMQKGEFAGGKVRIAHCQNPSAAEKLKNAICGLFPESDIRIEECTVLCSFYAEQGGLLVGYESK